jgi:hypothetical protein
MATPLRFAAAALGLVVAGGCGEMPAPATTQARDTDPPAHRGEAATMVSQPVSADAYSSVAAAMAEAEAAVASGKAEDQQKRVRVERWLGQQGERIAPELAALLADDNAGVETRLTACRVLARLGPAAEPALLQAAGCDARLVRIKALESLGRIQPTSRNIIAKLAAVLDEGDADGRKAALTGLAAIGPGAKQAQPALVARLTGILNDPQEDDTIRAAAHKALKAIDPRRALVE